MFPVIYDEMEEANPDSPIAPRHLGSPALEESPERETSNLGHTEPSEPWETVAEDEVLTSSEHPEMTSSPADLLTSPSLHQNNSKTPLLSPEAIRTSDPLRTPLPPDPLRTPLPPDPLRTPLPPDPLRSPLPPDPLRTPLPPDPLRTPLPPDPLRTPLAPPDQLGPPPGPLDPLPAAPVLTNETWPSTIATEEDSNLGLNGSSWEKGLSPEKVPPPFTPLPPPALVDLSRKSSARSPLTIQPTPVEPPNIRDVIEIRVDKATSDSMFTMVDSATQGSLNWPPRLVEEAVQCQLLPTATWRVDYHLPHPPVPAFDCQESHRQSAFSSANPCRILANAIGFVTPVFHFRFWVILMIYVFLAFTFPFSLLCCVVMVPSFQRAEVYRLGKHRKSVQGPEVALVLPFLDVCKLVDMRLQSLEMEKLESYSRDGVHVSVDATVAFSVVDSLKLVASVQSPSSAIRTVAVGCVKQAIGQMKVFTIVRRRLSLADAAQRLLIERVSPWGLAVEAVFIKNIRVDEHVQRLMIQKAEITVRNGIRKRALQGDIMTAIQCKDFADVVGKDFYPAWLLGRRIPAEAGSTRSLQSRSNALKYTSKKCSYYQGPQDYRRHRGYGQEQPGEGFNETWGPWGWPPSFFGDRYPLCDRGASPTRRGQWSLRRDAPFWTMNLSPIRRKRRRKLLNNSRSSGKDGEGRNPSRFCLSEGSERKADAVEETTPKEVVAPELVPPEEEDRKVEEAAEQKPKKPLTDIISKWESKVCKCQGKLSPSHLAQKKKSKLSKPGDAANVPQCSLGSGEGTTSVLQA